MIYVFVDLAEKCQTIMKHMFLRPFHIIKECVCITLQRAADVFQSVTSTDEKLMTCGLMQSSETVYQTRIFVLFLLISLFFH